MAIIALIIYPIRFNSTISSIYDCMQHNGVAHLMFINASQGPYQKYEDIRREIYNCNANIYFKHQ